MTGKGSEQEHSHPGSKDEETAEISDTARSEDVATTVIMAIALGVWIVEMIVGLWDIHREGSEAPFGRVGCM